MSDLTAKQQRFVEEYLVDLNATQAAIRAGYSEDTAAKIGSENLTKPDIATAISAAKVDLTRRCGVTQERIVKELSAIAFSDARKLYDEQGNLRPIHELEDEVAAAFAGLENEELFEGRGQDRKRIGVLRKVKRWDKVRALELLAKHLGVIEDKVKLSGSLDVNARAVVNLTLAQTG